MAFSEWLMRIVKLLALSSLWWFAGIDGLTLHGLRRSFKNLAEWVEMPTGVVAQMKT